MTAQAPVYVIEDGVPIPGAALRALRKAVYDLNIGQSVFEPCGDADELTTKLRLRSVTQTATKKLDRRFSIHRVEGGYRVWRVA